jgi:hypothetical protein
MKHLAVIEDLSGKLTAVGPGLLDATLATCGGGSGTLVSQLTFADTSRFSEEGRIEFGNGDALYFRTLCPGHLASAPDPSLHLGTAVREVRRGTGALRGAAGRITSTFAVDRNGNVSDREVALVFLAPVPGVESEGQTQRSTT